MVQTLVCTLRTIVIREHIELLLSRELDGQRVLLVVDHPSNVGDIEDLLENAGATVDRAVGFGEGAHVLREACLHSSMPDAVVCDLLPGGTAIGITEELSKLAPHCDIPRIAISALPEMEGPSLRAGFDEFLPKLVSPVLPIALAQLLRRKR